MNADGSAQANITNDGNCNGWPEYSPTGDRIAFGTTRDGNHEICVINESGRGPQTNVTNSPSTTDYTLDR